MRLQRAYRLISGACRRYQESVRGNLTHTKNRLPWFKRRGSRIWVSLVVLVVTGLFLGTLITNRISEGDWLDGSDWQAIWAFFALLVAALAASVALAQLAAHHEMQREISRPYVIVDFSFKSVLLSLEVKNIGQTPAKNIHFSWDVEPQVSDPRLNQILGRGLVTEGIPFLAPGRAIQYRLGRADEYWKNEELPDRFEVVATYTDMRQMPYGREEVMIIDLNQWAETRGETDYENKNWNQFKWQTEALRKIASSLATLEENVEYSPPKTGQSPYEKNSNCDRISDKPAIDE